MNTPAPRIWTTAASAMAVIVATALVVRHSLDNAASPTSAAPEAAAVTAGDGDSFAKRRAGFPPLAALPKLAVPADNPLNPAKIELGRFLFFDDRLSGDISTSCASCHDPRLGWGDGNALSRGYPGTQHWRNSQTVVNSAFYAKLFWAGESTSLEKQADSAITGNLAGNGDPEMIEERLAQVPAYVTLFKEAFGADRPTYLLVLKAIASFERASTLSLDSPFDRYMSGDQTALSESDLRGKAVFEGKAGCIQCHNGALASDEGFHNTGVPENPLFRRDPQRQIALRFQFYTRGVPEETYQNAVGDLGLYFTTKREADRGKFRTPQLRYLKYSAPYMHNGVFATLEEVVDFYDLGGGHGPGKSPLLRPLGLTASEKTDLLAFLESMSGSEVAMDPPRIPPYAATVEATDGEGK
ncbi:MAG: cytochrome-c peroxidase [Planctomycetes bacterium]|nr:cytochrome-c peroxidase [Planctomycetota bacterium]